jgi:hypothetical protein
MLRPALFFLHLSVWSFRISPWLPRLPRADATPTPLGHGAEKGPPNRHRRYVTLHDTPTHLPTHTRPELRTHCRLSRGISWHLRYSGTMGPATSSISVPAATTRRFQPRTHSCNGTLHLTTLWGHTTSATARCEHGSCVRIMRMRFFGPLHSPGARKGEVSGVRSC